MRRSPYPLGYFIGNKVRENLDQITIFDIYMPSSVFDIYMPSSVDKHQRDKDL